MFDAGVSLEEVDKCEDTAAAGELDPAKFHTATARKKLTTCEGQAAQRFGMGSRMVHDPLDNLPRQSEWIHGKAGMKQRSTGTEKGQRKRMRGTRYASTRKGDLERGGI